MFSLENFKAGNKLEWDWVVQEFETPFQAQVRYRTGDKVFAKDLVQEAFVKLWLKRDKIESLDHLENYLKQIIKNNILDYHRAKNRLNQLKDYLNEVLFRLEANPNDDYSLSFDTVIFDRALRKLTPREQQILSMSIDGLSPKEIAAHLNVPLNTVKHYKRVGKKHLTGEYLKLFEKKDEKSSPF